MNLVIDGDVRYFACFFQCWLIRLFMMTNTLTPFVWVLVFLNYGLMIILDFRLIIPI